MVSRAPPPCSSISAAAFSLFFLFNLWSGNIVIVGGIVDSPSNGEKERNEDVMSRLELDDDGPFLHSAITSSTGSSLIVTRLLCRSLGSGCLANAVTTAGRTAALDFFWQRRFCRTTVTLRHGSR